MLKSVTVTRHDTVERWNSWIVSVPDDMDNNSIQELMIELCENGDLELDEEEYHGDDDVSVDITEAPPAITTPDLTLNENGLVDEESALTAFTTDRLQAELERRQAKDCNTIVV